MDKSNYAEAAHRAVKVTALVAVLTVDAVASGKNWLSLEFVEELRSAGQDFWKKAAQKAGVIMPSLTAQAACKNCAGRGFHSAPVEGEEPCGWTGEKQQPAKNAYEPPREKDEYEKSFKEWRRDDLAWKHREVG